MTILGALAERYDRLAARGEAPVPGFAPAHISFALVLDRSGRVVTVDDERVADGKRMKPKVIEAPGRPKATVNVASGAFWDKTSYALGRSAPDPKASAERNAHDMLRTADEHAAFKKRNEALLTRADDEGCRALLAFLRNWNPQDYEQLRHAAEMLDKNVAFRLEGENRYIHQSAAARTALAAEAAAAAEVGVCLVSGERAPIARLHPSIKGVRGAQSSGAALVSFNLDAFTSYGKVQGDNAPVSEAAAFAYTTALNALLSATAGVDAKSGRPRYRNRVGLGADTVLFWAETEAAERVLGGLFAPLPADERTETASLQKVMEAIQAGRPLHDAAPELDPATRAFVLGLTPNAARLSVRFWLDRSLGELAARFREHWDDLHLEPVPGLRARTLWALLTELAVHRKKTTEKIKPEDVPGHLAGELMRAILTGGLYPRSLLSQALMRTRAEGTLRPLRVALIKAVLVRRARKATEEARRNDPAYPEWKDPLVSLDREEANAGYRLGRLFAVMEAAQYAALGKVNAGVKDRFFAAASATPGHVFPLLLRGAQNHLSSARKKGKVGRAIRLDKEISEILGGLGGTAPFPRALSLDDQGRFVIGFYHEGAELRIPRAHGESIEDTEDAATAAGDEE